MNGIELKGFKALQGLLDDTKKPSASISDNSLIQVSINKLKPSSCQPRRHFAEENLKELAQSIREQGILQPLIIRQKDEWYEIIAGERRWRAASIAELTEVPALVRIISDAEALAIALVENMQRENLNPIEEAVGIKRLLDDCDFTHEQVAQVIGKSRATVTNLLRLLNLNESVKQLLHGGLIDFGHARALLALDSAQQIEVANKIAHSNNKISVRQTEDLVRQAKNSNKLLTFPAFKTGNITEWRNKIRSKVQANVNIKITNEGKSKVMLTFDSLDKLNEFIESIASD